MNKMEDSGDVHIKVTEISRNYSKLPEKLNSQIDLCKRLGIKEVWWNRVKDEISGVPFSEIEKYLKD